MLVPSDSGQAPEGNAGRKIKTSVEKIKESCITYHNIEGFCQRVHTTRELRVDSHLLKDTFINTSGEKLEKIRQSDL